MIRVGTKTEDVEKVLCPLWHIFVRFYGVNFCGLRPYSIRGGDSRFANV